MRVLTVTKGFRRIENLQAAHREHTWQLCSPKVFLFADRVSLLSSNDLLDHSWRDGADDRQVLLG
jgi:hypothetical protein